MEENKKTEVKKLTYEELENYARQISMQNSNLVAKLEEANLANLFTRINYLFQILQAHEFFASEFVEECAKEIAGYFKKENVEENGEG